MRRLLLLFIVSSASLATVAAPAFAHAHLQSATPPANSTLREAPPAIEVTFTESLEPRFSTLTLEDAAGRPVATPPARVAEDNPRKLVLALPSLGAGRYTVIWRVTSIDTHRTEGRFSFTIAGG